MGSSGSKVEYIGPYIGHLEGTTHHKTLVSWKEYYEKNIDFQDNYENVPCPCKTDLGNTVHNLVPSSNSNPIGAHVYYIDKDGYITFGIILTCNGCNTGSKKFVSTCNMLTMINCPQVKCVPFDATLRNENLDNYTYENNKFDFQKSVQTRKSKITDDKEQYRYGEKNYYKIEKKSGNYINFIINLDKLSINFYNTKNEKITIYKHELKINENIRFSPSKHPHVPEEIEPEQKQKKEETEEEKERKKEEKEEENWRKSRFSNNIVCKDYIGYEKSVKERKNIFKVINYVYLPQEDFVPESDDDEKEKNEAMFMKNLSKKLYRYWCTMMTNYCKNRKERRNRKCYCGKKFSNISSGSCIVFAKNDEGECIMGVVPFCSECIKKKELPELSQDEKNNGKKIYMNVVSIVDFYTLRSALELPNVTKIEYRNNENKKFGRNTPYVTIYEKNSEKETETELWEKDLHFLEFIHSMNKLRKELYENCGETDKEFVPQVVKVSL